MIWTSGQILSSAASTNRRGRKERPPTAQRQQSYGRHDSRFSARIQAAQPARHAPDLAGPDLAASGASPAASAAAVDAEVSSGRKPVPEVLPPDGAAEEGGGGTKFVQVPILMKTSFFVTKLDHLFPETFQALSNICGLGQPRCYKTFYGLILEIFVIS
jgi:hypothetical protein